MEIRQLRYFVEICKYRNFTRAADACYISTQGISMAILRLENELNRQLFVRDKQGVTLTPAAEFLLPRAKKMLALNSECEAYFATGATHQSVLPVAFAPGSRWRCGSTATPTAKRRWAAVRWRWASPAGRWHPINLNPGCWR